MWSRKGSCGPFVTFQLPLFAATPLLSLGDQRKVGCDGHSYHVVAVSSFSSSGQLTFSMIILVWGSTQPKNYFIPCSCLCFVHTYLYQFDTLACLFICPFWWCFPQLIATLLNYFAVKSSKNIIISIFSQGQFSPTLQYTLPSLKLSFWTSHTDYQKAALNQLCVTMILR